MWLASGFEYRVGGRRAAGVGVRPARREPHGGCASDRLRFCILAGFLRFLLFTALLVALVIFIVVPLAAGPLLSSMARDAGLEGDDVRVSLDLFGPSLFDGRAHGLRVQATEVRVPRAVIGELDVTLQGVSFADRSFESVNGTLTGLEVSGPGGEPLVVESVTLSGPSDDTLARGRLAAGEAETLIERAIEDAGLPVDAVRLGSGVVTVTRDGISGDGTLRVAGGALLLESEFTEPLVLLAPAPSESWRLAQVDIDPAAMTVDLTLDAAEFWEDVPGAS